MFDPINLVLNRADKRIRLNITELAFRAFIYGAIINKMGDYLRASDKFSLR